VERAVGWQRATQRVGVLVLLSALALTGCGGGSSKPASGTSPTTGPARSGVTQTGVQAQVAQAFVDFFAGRTPAARKIGLVENGSAFAAAIHRQAGSPIAKGTAATVSKVSMVSPTKADVVYTVSLGGTPVLEHQSGVAVEEDGTWKVSAQTFCALLKLEQQAPPVCT
jgi:hypothetical protein